MSLTTQLNGGQQFQPLPLTTADSPASFESFADSGALGSISGSIREGALPYMGMPPGLNGHSSLGAGSSDARWHHIQPKQSTGHSQLGMSPSASAMRPMSLGVSPSHQFHVPGPHFQPSSGSQHISSPGSQYMASPGIMSFIMHFCISSSGNLAYICISSSGNLAYMQGGPQLGPQWRASRTGGNMGIFDQQQLNNAFLTGTLGSQLFLSETTTEVGDEELTGFGDSDGDFREELLFEHDPVSESTIFSIPSEIGPSDGIMDCGGAQLGPGPECGPNGQLSGFTKGPNQGSYGGHGRGQTSKHGSTSSSRLGHKQQHKQAQAQNQQSYSSCSQFPQHSFTSGSQSGNSSGPPSRRFPSGDSSSHGSPAGVLHFQQRQHQQHSPHHPPNQHFSGSSLYRAGKAATLGKPTGDGLLPSPQMDTRGTYAADANNGRFMGLGSAGYTGAGIIPDGRGLPMAAGLGQQNFFGVGVPSWPAQHPLFPPGQLYATDQLFAGRKAGPSLVGLNKPPPTGKGAYRFQK